MCHKFDIQIQISQHLHLTEETVTGKARLDVSEGTYHWPKHLGIYYIGVFHPMAITPSHASKGIPAIYIRGGIGWEAELF